MKLTDNFRLSEFACKDGTAVPVKYMANCRQLARNLQVLRDEIGEALYISSAYRTESHNKAVGGARKSFHLTCQAADLSCKTKSPRTLKKFIIKLINQGKMSQGGIGLYQGFVHYDTRGYKSRWGL